MLAAHGWIAVIGLGFLIPLGIAISKASSHTRLWKAGFWLHVPVQVRLVACSHSQNLCVMSVYALFQRPSLCL